MKINMEVFEELGRDIRSFPKLVAWIVVLTGIAALAGYVFLIQGEGRLPAVQQQVSDTADNQEKMCIAEEGTGGAVVTAENKTVVGESDVILSKGAIKVTKNEDMTVFEVWNDGAKAGEIRREYPAQVSLWRESGGFYYLGVNNDGLGGYILFGGPDEVYKLDPMANDLSKIYSGSKRSGFASDVNQERLAAIEFSDVAGKPAVNVAVYDFTGQELGSYPVPARYGTAGEARFSQVGGRLVYEAAVGNPDAEEYAMFMIDLATGRQEQLGGQEQWD